MSKGRRENERKRNEATTNKALSSLNHYIGLLGNPYILRIIISGKTKVTFTDIKEEEAAVQQFASEKITSNKMSLILIYNNER